MRKVIIGGALVGALTLAVTSTALAQTTTMDASLRLSPSKAGTSKKPKRVKLTLGIQGGTQSGTGQPDTSTRLRVQLPKGIKWNGKLWPKAKRCSVSKANSRASASACPKGSKVGSGHVTALGGNGGVVEEIDLTAFVTTRGNLGLFLEATQPLPIATMLEGKVRRQTIDVSIPANIQEPITGVATGIKTLTFTLNGKTKVKGKSRGALESTSCSGGKWTSKVTNVLRTGTLTDSASAACRK